MPFPLSHLSTFKKSKNVGVAAGSSLLTGLAWGYKLDEASGVAADVLGVSPLTAVNSPVGVAAKINNGRKFAIASQQYMSAASTSAFQLGGNTPFSMAGWVYLNSIAGDPGVVTKYSGTNPEWLLFIEPSGGEFRFEAATGSGGAGVTPVSASTFGRVPTLTPCFVAVRYDLTKFYISVNAGPENSAAFTAGVFAGSCAFALASFNGAANYLDGWLDEWYCWKRDIGTAKVAALYNSGAGSTYPFTGIA